MKNGVLYMGVVMVWGSTWLVIKYQLAGVDPMISVVYRFGLAAVLLMAFCCFKGLNLRFCLRDHLLMALLGGLLFSVNYWLIYKAETYITSGLMAVVFSSIVFMNIANGSMFLNMPMDKKMIIGALFGITGIGMIFMPEINTFDLSDKGIIGICVGFGSVVLASLGNFLALKRRQSV